MKSIRNKLTIFAYRRPILLIMVFLRLAERAIGFHQFALGLFRL
jgi:hypothetical protein